MQTLQYNSVATRDFSQDRENFDSADLPDQFTAVDARDFDDIPQETLEVSDCYSDFFGDAYHECYPDALATEIHDFVRLVAHPYRRCFDAPTKSPKNEEIESAIRNKGKDGCCTFQRDTGKFIVRPLAQWMSFGHNLRRRHYYTSDRRVALLYFDVDCHRAYQDRNDALAARAMIEQEFSARLGVAPLFLESGNGENGYLKVNLILADPAEANVVFDELQDAIRLLFAKHGLMADFEIKGTITWQDRNGTLRAGRYGKLPMCAGDWTYNWHRRLLKAKRVTVADLKRFIAEVTAEVTAEDLVRHAHAKRRAFLSHYLPVGEKQRWRLLAEFGVATCEEQIVTFEGQEWIPRRFVGEQWIDKLWPGYEPDLTEQEPIEVMGVEPLPCAVTTKTFPKHSTRDLADLRAEPDSFVRQRASLLKFARLLKRVPTVDEALKFIKDQGLYTGAWGNRARRPRVRGILKFIAQTFDAKKCLKQGSTTATVNIGKYDAWAKAKFPHGISGGKKKVVTEDFEIIEVDQRTAVNCDFISVFMTISEYCLLLDKNDDDSLPHERAKDLWNWLHKNGLVSVPFDNRKWAVCRDQLETLGIIKITDRKYELHKAMRWAVAPFFPLLGLWKTKKHPSLGKPGSWRDLVDSTVIRRERQHNSLLRQRWVQNVDVDVIPVAQPPPGIDSG